VSSTSAEVDAQAAGQAMGPCVVDLGSVDEIPLGEGRSFDVEGVSIAVFRVRLSHGGAGLRAISAICPHAGGPLADGQIDGDVVICPLHLSVFELATGCSRSGQADVVGYPVREVNGRIMLDLSVG
jgi:nitrite reductase/ring-hydroxylating ferredoxin subunit